MVPAELPEQIVLPPVTAPPAAAGETTTTIESAFAVPQLPLCITALIAVDWVSEPGLSEVVVLLIVDHEVYGALALSQRITVPEWPARVNVPGELPVHTAAVPLTEPPVGPAVTATTSESAFAVPQLPFCTTARNAVDWVRVPALSDVVVLLMVDHEVYGALALSQRITDPV
jgi:hypothetical protein